MLPMLGGRLTGGQYSCQQGGSTEILIGYLDAFVEKNTCEGNAAYTVGLDIGGASDSAKFPRLFETLGRDAISGILVRPVGQRLARRSFRIKLGTQGGAILSRPRRPTRGAPQGGVSPPCFGFCASTNS